MSTEDLTSYTEVDPGSNISKTSSRVTLTALPTNLDSYLYKDFGANYFDAIELLFTIYFNSSSSIASLCAAGFTVNTLNDSSAWPTTSILIGLQKDGASSYILYLGDDDYTTISSNTAYYCKLVRAAGSGTAYLYIYTNSARTTLYDTLTCTGLGTSKYRYFYAACSYNAGVAGYNFYGYLENFEFLGSGSVVPIIIHHLRQQGIM